MKKDKKNKLPSITPEFFEDLWKESWTYIRTVVDVMREPILILDKNLKVMAANDPFYKIFQVEKQDTEGKMVYDLGNGQWNIPALKKLLEDVLPKNAFFKGFEVEHNFPFIGSKTMILNARQIHFKESSTLYGLPPIILLAIEDVTEMMQIATEIRNRSRNLEIELENRTRKMQENILKLEEDVASLKLKTGIR